MNHHPGKNLSLCLLYGCSHQEFSDISRSFLVLCRSLYLICCFFWTQFGHKKGRTTTCLSIKSKSHPAGFLSTYWRSKQRTTGLNQLTTAGIPEIKALVFGSVVMGFSFQVVDLPLDLRDALERSGCGVADGY
jgi:hypothetical protein